MSLRSKDRLRHILKETEFLLCLSPKIKVAKDLIDNEELGRLTVGSLTIVGEAVKGVAKEERDLIKPQY